MLLYLSQLLAQHFHFFHVFQYLTFRSIVSALTALVIALWMGPWFIRCLTTRQIGQPIREDGPKDHLAKQGTPTMGGTLILFSILISVLLWGNWLNAYIWLLLFGMLGFGLLGFVDDYLKIKCQNSDGLSKGSKLLGQGLIALIFSLWVYHTASLPQQTDLVLPFFKHAAIPLGVFFVCFAFLVVVGSSNAVNLTDGLDGLALLPTVIIAGALGVFAYLTGNAIFSRYLVIPYIPGIGEVGVFCGSIVGAGLGFLWFNTYPAQVFMGDVGSLGLGAALGMVAVLVRQELVFFIMGGIFVIETLSVIIQVASFRLTGRRVFKMAPLHHHFELKGWAEPKVIVRFWIITFILVLIGLATLKLR